MHGSPIGNMMEKNNFIRKGFTGVTPYLFIRNANKAIDFYKKAIELYPTIKKRFLFFTGTFDYKIISYLNQNNLRYLVKPSPVKDIKDAVSKILAL